MIVKLENLGNSASFLSRMRVNLDTSLVTSFVNLPFFPTCPQNHNTQFQKSLIEPMGDYRSTSYTDGRMQIQSYHGQRSPISNPHDLRSYSASYASSSYDLPQTHMGGVKDLKLKKGKSTVGPSWGFTDPEFQRKKRVASYKAYSVEGKVKRSFRKSFKWIKDRYNQVVNGWS